MSSSYSNPRGSSLFGLMGSTGITPTPDSGFAGPLARGMFGRWASGNVIPPPTPSESIGTGYGRWAEHWEFMARRKQIIQEDEELLVLLGR